MKKVKKDNCKIKCSKKLKKKSVQDQGVTMLALVITIIILLILSGITIRFVVGEDGIIGQAKQASLKYQNSALQEQILLNSIDEQIADISNGSGGGSGSGSGSSGGDSSSGDSQETVDELNQTIDDLQRQVDVLKEKLEETEKERDDNESRANDLQEQFNNSEAEKEQLKAQIAELENQINQLNKTISSLQSQIEQLQNEISNLKAKQAIGTANASDVIAGKTFSNSSGIGLIGTLVSRVAQTNAVSIGINGSTLYFRIPQGAYVTNADTGYPEIMASVSDINNITGYKYTQAQYDSNSIVYDFGQVSSVNISSLFSNYKSMTKDNFAIQITSASATATRNPKASGSNGGRTLSPSVSYDANTGVATVTGTSGSFSSNNNDAYPNSMSVSWHLLCFAKRVSK